MQKVAADIPNALKIVAEVFVAAALHVDTIMRKIISSILLMPFFVPVFFF